MDLDGKANPIHCAARIVLNAQELLLLSKKKKGTDQMFHCHSAFAMAKGHFVLISDHALWRVMEVFGINVRGIGAGCPNLLMLTNQSIYQLVVEIVFTLIAMVSCSQLTMGVSIISFGYLAIMGRAVQPRRSSKQLWRSLEIMQEEATGFDQFAIGGKERDN
jgi:hypothetical protein